MLIKELRPIAQLLDRSGESGYEDTLNQQNEKFEDAELTPSAKILKAMRDQDTSFFQFAIDKSIEHQNFFSEPRLPFQKNRKLIDEARNSIHCQQILEAADDKPFAEFLHQYFS